MLRSSDIPSGFHASGRAARPTSSARLIRAVTLALAAGATALVALTGVTITASFAAPLGF